MTGEWKLIVQGFAVAGVGAAASMLYIVGVSAAYFGKYALGSGALLLAVALSLGFRHGLRPYLKALDQREASFRKRD